MADRVGLNALGLGKEQLEGADFDSIPENLGQSFPDPIQPGSYRFRFPVFQPTSPIWESVETQEYGKRIVAIFEDDLELQIIQSKDNAHNGEGYRFRVSNVPRPRTKEKILVSDMDLVLRAFGVTARPKTNADYGAALAKHCSGKEFSATQEFSYRCDPNREIYVDDGAGGQVKQEGKNGCGARYYQRDVAKAADGSFPLRITCGNPDCGASIRAFGNLGGFKI